MELVPFKRPENQHPESKRDSFLRLDAVCGIVGLKKSAIYELMRRREFPRCIQLTPRSVAWSSAAVHQWVEDRKAASAMATGAQQ